MYSTATKGGMSAHSRKSAGHGSIVHAIPGSPMNGFWNTPALCGATPGSRGYGWHQIGSDVTCPKCLKKMASKIE